jgi:hypothetical protein
MSDEQPQRGPSPEDRLLFASNKAAILRRATQHYSWLIGQGYDALAAMKLVGDHFQLRQRQRLAITASSCTDRFRESRQKNQRLLSQLVGQPLAIDGLYAISTVEAAILGSVLLRGRDGALRELPLARRPSRHLAEETIRAIGLLTNLLSASQLKQVAWFLDRNASNSSPVREELEGLFNATKWPWTVEVVTDRSKHLTLFDGTIATTDSVLLDRVNEWIDIPSVVVDRFLPGAWIVDLTDPVT